jgi:hypothetical protein
MQHQQRPFNLLPEIMGKYRGGKNKALQFSSTWWQEIDRVRDILSGSEIYKSVIECLTKIKEQGEGCPLTLSF